MSMWARTLLFALLAVIGPSSDAKGYSHHYSHHYSHGRYRGPSRHTYRSSYGRAYFHGATHYWVTVLGFRYLYGTRNFNDCDQGQTCEWQQGCCHQEMSATVVTATASIVVDEKQSLPAFSPAYIPSPLSKELVRDARSTLAAHGVDIDEKLFVVAMLSPRTVTLRVLVPANANAATVARVLGAGATNGTRGSWNELAAPQYKFSCDDAACAPTTSSKSFAITADEDAMHTRLCDMGMQQQGKQGSQGSEKACAFADACATAPCSNGGICFQGLDTYGCDCRSGWNGPQCEEKVAECTDDEREDICSGSGAICEHLSISEGAGTADGSHGAGRMNPQCRCPYGKVYVDGSGCVDRDECALAESPCSQHGTCLQSSSDVAARTSEKGVVTTVPVGEFLCVCEGSWQGPRCALPPDPVSGVIIIGGVILFVCVVCAISNQIAECQEKRAAQKLKYSQVKQDGGIGAKTAQQNAGARGGRSTTANGGGTMSRSNGGTGKPAGAARSNGYAHRSTAGSAGPVKF